MQDGEDFYWLINLGESIQIPMLLAGKTKQRTFRVRLVSFHDFLQTESWDNIPTKYLNNSSIRRRSMQ